MKVKAGQVCAKIDPRPYQIMVDRIKSDLAGAEARFAKDKADLAQAKAALEHHEALAERRAISHTAIEKSLKTYEQAQARTKLQEVTVGQLQAALQSYLHGRVLAKPSFHRGRDANRAIAADSRASNKL